MPTPGTRVLTNQRVAWYLGPDSAISDYSKPTLAQIATLLNISEAVKIEGTDFNTDASDQQDDRSYTDGAGAQSRSFAQFGGPITLFTPKPADTTSILRTARTMLKTPRTNLALVRRLVTLNSIGLAVADEIDVFRVQTDANRHNRSETSYSYTINLVPRDDVTINYIVPSAAPTAVALTPATAIVTTIGTVGYHTALYEGRNVTIGTIYTSSNSAVVEALPHGGWRALAAGSASITPSYPGSAAGAAKTFTVS